ncbi:MAG: dihydrolipoyl dehydrogenase [Xanthomonadales bacterium]|nr:dihydrolipoyl dehydrogenase [Xanthomonadales bacterium]
MSRTKLLVLAVITLLISTVLWLDLYQFITLENFRASQSTVTSWVAANPLLAALTFFILYIAITGVNIPGAAAMTLIGGALFGLVQGTVLVSFASTIGATLAFLLSRYLLRDYMEQHFAATVSRINKGIATDGPYYLFTLRLIPAFPFFVINMVMGLTRLKVPTYFWVSQVGMLPATIVFVNAGTQIGQIDSLAGILSPQLIGSFVLLGLFPLLTRKLLTSFNARKLRRSARHFKKPRSYDTNLVVIGAGSAGLVTAYIAAAAGAKVTLIEKDKMGGDCLNTGCVPSKALIRSSRIKSYIDRSREFGINTGHAETDFPAVMQRVRDVITTIEPHDSIERYTSLGVDCVQGEAHITSPWSVEINGQTIHTRSMVIATGGGPTLPPIPGLDAIDFLTSDNLWTLQELPQELLVLGGGAIGCELAQAFRRLGSEVTIVEMLPRLLANEDEAVSTEVERSFHDDGIIVLTETRVTAFEHTTNGNEIAIENAGGKQRIVLDKVLVATGRRGNTANLGLEDLGITSNPNGTIPVNEYLQTIYPNIYACGDVAGPYQLTHAAAHQAWYCAMNALFARFWKFRVDYTVLPRAVFCDPEVASVGINEQQAIEQGIKHEITTYHMADLDRAIADGEARGFVRVITPPGNDRILGVTIVGPHAGDIISEYVLAMRNGLGLGKILGTVHIYPTLAEANKFAAGSWRKAHLSKRLLRISRWINQIRIK